MFVSARKDSDWQALAAYRASSLAARRFGWLMGLALTNDGLLACSFDDPSTALYKFAQDGSMDELATVSVHAVYDRGFKRCAVHQQTQRTYAIGEDEEGNQALFLLDANLQVVATVEAGFDICDVAVHGDQVIVLTTDDHPKGSGLQLLDLDGQFLRTIAAEQFIYPYAFTTSHGRAYVIDDDDADDHDDDHDYDESGKVLHVIDIQSGDVLQTVNVDLKGNVSAMIVDGNEIYIASYSADEVVVLRYAGSEA